MDFKSVVGPDKNLAGSAILHIDFDLTSDRVGNGEGVGFRFAIESDRVLNRVTVNYFKMKSGIASSSEVMTALLKRCVGYPIYDQIFSRGPFARLLASMQDMGSNCKPEGREEESAIGQKKNSCASSKRFFGDSDWCDADACGKIARRAN